MQPSDALFKPAFVTFSDERTWEFCSVATHYLAKNAKCAAQNSFEHGDLHL